METDVAELPQQGCKRTAEIKTHLSKMLLLTCIHTIGKKNLSAIFFKIPFQWQYKVIKHQFQ